MIASIDYGARISHHSIGIWWVTRIKEQLVRDAKLDEFIIKFWGKHAGNSAVQQLVKNG